MKQLVVYFSHTGENMINNQIVVLEKGNTEVVAEKIQQLTGADIFKIEPVKPYPETYFECNSLSREENETNKCSDLKATIDSIDQYDVIYVGFPIWHRTFPAIVAKFLRQYNFAGKTVLPFCTNDEGGFGTAELEIKYHLKGALIKSGLAIHGSKVYTSDDKISNWIIK